MNSALFDETSRPQWASDDSWKHNNRMKTSTTSSGDKLGKQKMGDFNGGGEDVAKKG